MKKIIFMVTVCFLLALAGCGGNNGSDKGGNAYVGRWQASIKNGFQTQTLVYDISHSGGNEYLITMELDGLKQARTMMAVYEKNTLRVPPFNDEAVLDGTERMILQGMDFKKLK